MYNYLVFLLFDVQYLNTNHDLYDAVKKAEQECHMLSEEAKRGVRNLRIDFERAGIHLCPGIHITSGVMLCS